MKYYELDKEEKKILDDFEKGKYKDIPNLKKEIEIGRASCRERV